MSYLILYVNNEIRFIEVSEPVTDFKVVNNHYKYYTFNAIRRRSSMTDLEVKFTEVIEPVTYLICVENEVRFIEAVTDFEVININLSQSI